MSILNLSTDVPWKYIDASPDLTERNFRRDEFKPIWLRPSSAISDSKPRPEDSLEQLFNKRISYVKITCSVSRLTLSLKEKEIMRISHMSGRQGGHLSNSKVRWRK